MIGGCINQVKYNIYRAIAAEDTAFVTHYLSTGRDLNLFEQSGWTLLMCAVEYENKEIMDILITNGANINYQCSGGWTALHQAVDLSIDGTIQTGGSPGEEPVDILEYLLDCGADVPITDSKGSSPIDVAMSCKSEKNRPIFRRISASTA
ncbi:ankyrin repeat domain-containing protein [Paenibacillus illinoisensis]|uniref:ankyrin repeat domain-containing protein n=1 Tax=Paenibacillus illinoisensis TaxID=59845 RepID=UPI001C8D53B9|nr:ankyrin repeat domain-containing protein [Paenibacillus illinoisensis]MBY0217774.1 ankyrin repeat domain-containing protein [Paenibacillus illinoisensis]